jgi:hypothetical protein
VKTAKALEDLVGRLRGAGRFTVDVESTSAEEMDAQLVGISIAPPTEDADVREAYYIPVGHLEATEDGPPGSTRASFRWTRCASSSARYWQIPPCSRTRTTPSTT